MANDSSVSLGKADGLGVHPATETWLRGFHHIHKSFVDMARVRYSIERANVALRNSATAVRECEDLLKRLEKEGW